MEKLPLILMLFIGGIPLLFLLLSSLYIKSTSKTTRDKKLKNVEYRKCILKKFNEIESKWKKRLNFIPREFRNQRIQIDIGKFTLSHRVTSKDIHLFYDGDLKILGGWIGSGFRFEACGKCHPLTELQKEWVVLNYNNGLDKLISEKCSEMENSIVDEIYEEERKLFSAMSVTV